MSYDNDTVKRVRRILAGRESEEKRMIGGLCFMLRGHLFCGVNASGLLVRVGVTEHKRLLSQPHVHQMKLGGRSLPGFVVVESNGFRTDEDLAAWIQRAIDFTSDLPEKWPARTPS